MTPVKLVVKGVYDTEIEYSFDTAKNIYPLSDAEKIKQSLGYAIFGNDALYKGEVIFEFESGDDKYFLDRNFEANTVKLTVNGTDVSDETESRLNDLFRVTPSQWAEFALASKHTVFDGTKADLNKYVEDLFANMKIDEDTLNGSDEEYKSKLNVLDNKLEILNQLSDGDMEEYEKRLSVLSQEITSIKEDSAKLSELIGIGGIYKTTADKLAKATELLERENAKATRIETDKQRLERSNMIKAHFAMAETVAAVEEEAESFKKMLDEKEARLADMNTSLTAGAKVLKKKERAYIDANERVVALNIALDELIKESRENGRSDEYVREHLAPFCKERDETLEELKKIYDEKAEEKRKVEERLNEINNTWENARLNAEYRKAVREGACFETSVKEKKFTASTLAKEIDFENAEIEVLEKELERNTEIIRLCNERYNKLFGSNGKKVTLRSLAEDFNELERIKQSLYRNQILSAVLLQDINAIDKKIGDNTEVKRSCEENKEALISARKTLEQYTEKCNAQFLEVEKEFGEVAAEKKYYENIDKLEYGAKCPVCSSLVTDKPDAELKIEALMDKENSLAAEMKRLKDIMAEYADKLGRINARMGSLTSTENASATYIDSLENAKIAKLATLKKIYAENNVSSHDELTADLEKAIAEVAELSTAVVSIKELLATEAAAETDIKNIKTRLYNLKNVSLPEKESLLMSLDADIIKYEEESNNFAKLFDEDKTALSQLEDIIVLETTDDECYAENKELLAKRDELINVMESITNDMNALIGNEFKFNKDGKELDYTDLCVSIISDRYDEVIAEIRRSEDVRLQAKDELVAVSRVLQDKQAKADAMQAEYDEIKKNYDVNMAYIDTIKESQLKNEEAFKDVDFVSIKNEMLDDKAEESIKEEILTHENATHKINCEIEALTEILEASKDAYEGMEENAAAIKELNKILNSRLTEYKDLTEKYYFNKRISENITDINKEQNEVRRKKADVSNVLSGTASDLVITKTNNALSILMPKYRVKFKDNGLIVLKTELNGMEKELVRLEDDEYIVVSVSLINAVKQIVAETLNSDGLVQVVCVQSNLVKETTRTALREFAFKNGLIILFHK